MANNSAVLHKGDNNSSDISHAKRLSGGVSGTGDIAGEVISVGDWVLFYPDRHVDYMKHKNIIFPCRGILNAYPVAGDLDCLETYSIRNSIILGGFSYLKRSLDWVFAKRCARGLRNIYNFINMIDF